MQRFCLVTLAGLGLSGFSGCGMGGTTQEDMMRHAIRRPSDDDEENDATPVEVAKPAVEVSPADVPREVSAAAARDVSAPAGSINAAPPLATASEELDFPVAAIGLPPDAPTTPEGRKALSREHLTAIGIALNQYVAEKGAFPAPAIYDRRKEPLLSWRVALLPYLGHWRLYQEFDRDAAWDSPHNRALIKRIPDVYKSPERWDGTTNYQAIVGRTTLFPGVRPVAPRRIEDGRDNTMALVEVDDEAAVPWTQPQDFTVDVQRPIRSLGSLRNGSFLSVFADGSVIEVDAAASSQDLWAAFTFEGGEEFSVRDLVVVEESVPGSLSPAPAPIAASRSDSQTQGTSRGRGGLAPPVTRAPLPAADIRRAATQLVKDLFKEKFERARGNAKAAVAEEMVELAQTVESTAERYVLLDTAKEIAIVTGDVELMTEIVDQIELFFEVDRITLRTEAGEKIARALTGRKSAAFVEWAADTGREALAAGRYKEGAKLVEVALSQASQSSDRELRDAMRDLNASLDYARDLRHEADEAYAVLEQDPTNGIANTRLARYLCFVEEDWENGLAIMANCTSPPLKRLAMLEMDSSQEPADKLVIADTWWELAERKDGPEQRAMAKRAIHWYRQAVEGLPPGLLTIRAQRRIEQYEQVVEERVLQ